MRMHFPNPHLLAYIAMADAYCMSVEYVHPIARADHIQQALRFEKYVRHPKHNLEPGQYTDDGEMSCANAHVLLDYSPPFTAKQFAEAYVAEFNRGGQREGYSQGLYSVLKDPKTKKGSDLIRALKKHGNKSDKNGACMRASVLGVLPTVGVVLEAATTQARITHDSPVGRFSARAVALMAHFAMYSNAPLAQMGDFCVNKLPDEDLPYMNIFFEPWEGPVKSDPVSGRSVGLATVHAAFHVIETEMTKMLPSLMGMLEQVIQLGGDTDTVAAVVWGIASSRFQNDDLPEFLFQDLEGGSPHTGLPHLINLGTQLMQKYGARS